MKIIYLCMETSEPYCTRMCKYESKMTRKGKSLPNVWQDDNGDNAKQKKITSYPRGLKIENVLTAGQHITNLCFLFGKLNYISWLQVPWFKSFHKSIQNILNCWVKKSYQHAWSVFRLIISFLWIWIIFSKELKLFSSFNITWPIF